jgi:hypothetical protein
MDWSNEEYVRLYTRDTEDWVSLPWQSRALLPLLMRKMDRAGVIAAKRGPRGISLLVHLPIEVVEDGLQGLIDDGCLVEHDRGYLMPNFMEAQEAKKSDRERSREYRRRRRDDAFASSVARDANVTGHHEPSRDATKSDATVTPRDASVTPHHEPSRAITPRHSPSADPPSTIPPRALSETNARAGISVTERTLLDRLRRFRVDLVRKLQTDGVDPGGPTPTMHVDGQTEMRALSLVRSWMAAAKELGRDPEEFVNENAGRLFTSLEREAREKRSLATLRETVCWEPKVVDWALNGGVARVRNQNESGRPPEPFRPPLTSWNK